MEYLIGIGIFVFLYLFYTSKKKSEWNSQYRIALGSYFGLTAEQAKNENNFDGVVALPAGILAGSFSERFNKK